jgi:phosphonate transport system permease protein
MRIVSNANSVAVSAADFSGRLWTPRRAAAVLAGALVVALCWQVDGVRLSTVFRAETAQAFATLIRGLFPPDFSAPFLRVVFRAMVSTLATAIAGTVLSVLIAIPLGAFSTPILWRRGILAGAENGRFGALLRSSASRAVFAFLGFLRAVPDLVWALLFVTAVGLGSLPGTLALAVAYAGVLGRVYADAFSDVDARPLEALQATGATRMQIFLRGIWPQALPNVTAYTLYSFECCVRAASVLGFVGAGGIGYEISLSMRLFEYGQVMTLILAFVVLLATTDVVSRKLRERLQSASDLGPGFGAAFGWGGGSDLVSHKKTADSNALRKSWPAARFVLLALVLVASFYLAGFSPDRLAGNNLLRNIFRFCAAMAPPDLARSFVLSLGPLIAQTVAISVLGTLMGIIIGAALAIPATSTLILVRRGSPGAHPPAERGIRWSIFWSARLLLNFLRSIPDLVWVLVCILLVGIGPFAGTLAIGLHTAGVLGKLYAETLEEVPQRPVEALRALGAGPFQLLVWALWPQAKGMLASYTVVRWEMNLRISAILGLVGGGGLGQAIYNNVQLGFYARLGTLLLVIYGLVICSDWLGDNVVRRAYRT